MISYYCLFADNFGVGLGSMILAVMQIALQLCSFSQLRHFVELDVDDIGHYDLICGFYWDLGMKFQKFSETF